MRVSSSLLSLPVLGLLLLAPESHAEEAASQSADQVKYRQAIFGAIGQDMKAMGMIVKERVPDNTASRVVHANSLHQHSTVLPHIFAEGTGMDTHSNSEALAAIWADPEAFASAIKTFQDETAKLVEVAGSDDLSVVKAQFGMVGRSCGGCHDNFRKDDD